MVSGLAEMASGASVPADGTAQAETGATSLDTGLAVLTKNNAALTDGAQAIFMAVLSEAVLIHAVQHYELQAFIAGQALMQKTDSLSIPIIPAPFLDQTGAPPAFAVPETRVAIFFTGGTTGTPKGVMLSHGAILRGALNGTYREGTVFEQTMVAALPFTHVFGMIFSMLSSLYTGAHVAVCGNMRELFKEMTRVKPTTMIAVPGMAEMMLSIAQKREGCMPWAAG